MRTTVEDPDGQGTMRYGLGLMRYTSPCGVQAADQKAVDAAVCAMLGKPAPQN
jgi:hypothetical protein